MQHLNNYRGLAISLVIASHAAATLPDPHPSSVSFFSPLFGCGTILFILAAGYFFTTLSATDSYTSYLKSKIKNVIAPYIILSMPAALIYITGLKTHHDWLDLQWLSSLPTLEAYLYLMITGAQLGPLWFIPMVIIFYILCPVWQLLIKKSLLLPAIFLALIAATAAGRPMHNENSLQSAIFFLPAYLTGMLIPSLGIEKHKEIPSKALLVGTLLALLLNGWLNAKASVLTPVLSLAFAIAMLLFTSQHLTKKIKILDLMARLSFFLFFVHGYFIAAFRIKLHERQITTMAWPTIAAVSIITILLSLALYIPLKAALKDRSKFVLAA